MKKVTMIHQKKLIRAIIIFAITLLIGGSTVSGIGNKNIGQIADQILLFFTANQEGDSGITEVVRAIDGDTIIVMQDGIEYKVRLIGVDTPESTGKYKNNPQPGGKEASDFLTELLPPGRKIYMTADAGDTDKYGRLLRYVWLDPPDDKKADEIMVNCILLVEGYAQLMTVPPNVKYVDLFTEIKKR